MEDSKNNNKKGVLVITSSISKPFLLDKNFYLKFGFKVIDTYAPYFELLEFQIAPSVIEKPTFIKSNISQYIKDFTFVYNNQCPFAEEYVQLLS